MDIKDKILVVGIGGCSRSGKTLLVNELINQYKQLNKSNYALDICEVMHLDDYANHQKVMMNKFTTSLGNSYGNWEFPGSLEWDIFYTNIKVKLKNMNSKIQRDAKYKNKKGILFIEGFLIFSPLMRNKSDENDYLNLFDVFIFISLSKSIAKMRRMKTTSVPNDYYEEILWPEYIKNCSKYINYFIEQKNKNKNVLIINGNEEYNINKMTVCILKWLNIVDVEPDKYMYSTLLKPFNEQIYLIEDSLAS